LIDSGIIWKNEKNKWYRRCPKCSVPIEYDSFDCCQTSNKKNRKCLNCCHPELYKNSFASILLDSKTIWEENNIWYRECPGCLKILKYSQKNMCVWASKNKWKYLSCSKKGKNNPNYKKSRTDETKEKIRLSNIGNHVCSDEYRLKLSKAQINSGKNYFINSGGDNGYKRKLYIFPNGKTKYVQGYEPYTINLLLSSSIDQNNIKIGKGEVPIILYEWSGSIRKYFPDCYIPTLNTIVETKCNWTWKFQKEQNNAKITSSLNSGYDVRVIIWEASKYKKVLVSDTTYVLKKSV
jgi:hypothetical protein